MSTLARVHHLPGLESERIRDLDDQVRQLQPGQWARVTWKDEDGTTGVTEGTVTKPSHLTDSLFIGHRFCLHVRGYANVTITSLQTEQRPALDLDELADHVGDWAQAAVAFEEKPVGRFQTGDNTAEATALFEAEQRVLTYLRGVKL